MKSKNMIINYYTLINHQSYLFINLLQYTFITIMFDFVIHICYYIINNINVIHAYSL